MKQKKNEEKLITNNLILMTIVNFCKKKSYECVYGEAKLFNEFMSSSKVFYFFFIKVYYNFTLIFASQKIKKRNYLN